MIELNVIIDDSFFKTKAALQVFLMGGLPHLEKSVDDSLHHVQKKWRETANATFKYRTGSYNQAVQVEYPLTEDNLYGQVINRLPYAMVLEKGQTSAQRMNILNTSHQIRINKLGGKYLIIPFRHGIPGSVTMRPMPASVYKEAKELSYSRRVGTYLEFSMQLIEASRKDMDLIGNFGNPVPLAKPRATTGNIPLAKRFKYAWGDRLTGVGGRHEGMVKMGKKGHSQFMTFRVMSEHGKPWKGTPAFRVAGTTAEQVKPEVTTILENGFKKDVEEMKKIAGI